MFMAILQQAHNISLNFGTILVIPESHAILTELFEQTIAAHVCQLQIKIVGVHGRQTFAMLITYYDKQQLDFISIKNAKDVLVSFDYETGLLELSYKVGRCYFSNEMPITTSIAIGDEND